MFRPRLRASRPALVASLAAGLLLSCALVPAVAADLDAKKKDVEDRIEQADSHVHESDAAIDAATDALLRARSDLANAQSFLAQTQDDLEVAQARDVRMQDALAQARQRLRTARAELVVGEADMAGQEDQLRAMVVSSYEQGDPALLGLSMVFTTQDPAQLAGSMNASSSVVDKESSVLDRLEATKVLLTVKEEETEAAKVEVAAKRAAAADNLRAKEALEQQASQAEAQVAEMVTLRSQARDLALQAKEKDLAALAKLQTERERIQDLIAAQASVGTGYTGPSTGNGFLDYPVTGPITSSFGWRIHPIFGYRSFHDGTDFGVACGSPIRAAAGGTVLSEYYSSSYGNRLIIDHGVRYGVGLATISNHMSGYAVAPGDTVRRGDVIGYVGSTGWSTGCHLHFTVMENGVPVDPMRWF